MFYNNLKSVTVCKQFQNARTKLQNEIKVCDSQYFTHHFILKPADRYAVSFGKSVLHQAVHHILHLVAKGQSNVSQFEAARIMDLKVWQREGEGGLM
jgi:hypothetical protein